MSNAWTFAIAATSIVLSAISFYSSAAQAKGWWPWTKWTSMSRLRVTVGKTYEVQRDHDLPWYAFPWAVLHPHGGVVGVAMTRWGAMRILRRATGVRHRA